MSEESGYHISVFNSSGEGLRLFNTPRGVTVDGERNILVIDINNHCLQKFTADGQFLSAVGTRGSEPLQFQEPKDLALNPRNGMWMITAVFKLLNSDLTFFATYGTKGSNEGQLKYPCGITCDSTGNVYVVDSGNQVFTAEGRFIRKFGSLGSDCGQLMLPMDSSSWWISVH